MRYSLKLVAALASLCVPLAHAQEFPARAIHIIVPTSGGGLNDLLSRTIGNQVAAQTGQPVVIDNRPGAATFIGMSACAKAPPDGYTVCVTTPESLTFNPLLFTNLPYDPDNDFAPVTILSRGRGGSIIASAELPVSTFPEIIAYAKANPGKLNYATWGPASVPAMYLEWINRQNGISITAVPYKGAGPSIPAILSNQVQLTYTGYSLVASHIKAGKLKLIAMTGSQRSPMLPSVPSLGEFNSDPGLDSYFAMFAPAKTPAPIVERVSAEFARAIRTPKIQEFLTSQFQVGVGLTPAEFTEFLKKDRADAARIFKVLGIRRGDSPS